MVTFRGHKKNRKKLVNGTHIENLVLAQPTIEHCHRVLKLPSKPDFGTLRTLEGLRLSAPFVLKIQKMGPSQTMAECIRTKRGSKERNVTKFFFLLKKRFIPVILTP